MEHVLAIVLAAVCTAALTYFDQQWFGFDWAWWLWAIICLLVAYGLLGLYIVVGDSD